MSDDARAVGSQGPCSEPLVLQKFIDGELPGPAAELVAHHLESCARCGAALADLKALSFFVQTRLGAEDEGEEEASSRALRAVASRLPGTVKPAAPQPWVAWVARWRTPMWFATAATLVLAFLLSLPFSERIDASAESIFAENRSREHAWLYQPNKVLHWEVRTVANGIRGLPDGVERTVFWRRNGAATFDEISRRYDAGHRTLWAYWQQPDGSSISYQANTGPQIRKSPSTDVLRQTLPTLDSDLRAALEMFLRRRERVRSIQLESREFSEWLDHAGGASGERTTVRRTTTSEWGQVYRVTGVTDYEHREDGLVQSKHEHDIEGHGFRRVRLKSTLTYEDGSIGVHESRWTAFGESSEADFQSQVPRDLLQQGMPIVELTPLDIARRQRREMDGLRIGTR